MALIKKDSATPVTKPAVKPAVKPPVKSTRPAVEADPEDGEDGEGEGQMAQAEQDAAVAEKPAVSHRIPAQTAPAVIAPKGGLLATTRMAPVIEDLKNALVVNFDTLPHLQINQGNVLVKEGKVMLGDAVVLELLSYQDQFVVSPGEDGEEALKALRYSNDGLTCTTGEDVQDYLRSLQDADYPNAQLKERCVLVVNLISSDKGAKVAQYYDNLYQIDIAPSTKSKFDAYRAQVSFKVSRNKMDAADSPYMYVTVKVVERGTMSWSVASFETATLEQRGLA